MLLTKLNEGFFRGDLNDHVRNKRGKEKELNIFKEWSKTTIFVFESESIRNLIAK